MENNRNKISARKIALNSVFVFSILSSSIGLALAAETEEQKEPSKKARGNDVLTEVIQVTARKFQEPLASVPIAVTAFTGDQMKVLGVTETGDLANLTPNFTWNTEFGRASPQPYLRGIGSNNFNPINSGPIAIYQDGVYIGPNIAQGFATFDAERAEVLKGPQGTLYGRNSTGGLVNFISKKPEIDGGTNGYVNIELGQYETTNIETALGFDIGDTAAGRIAVVRNLNGGTFDNKNPDIDEDVNVIDDVALRASFLYEPSDDLSVLFNYHYGKSSPDTAPFKQIALFEPGTWDPCLSEPALGANCAAGDSEVDIAPGLFETAKNKDSEHVETSGAFLQIEYYFTDDLSLSSVTSYDTAELARLDDADDTITQLEMDHYSDDFTFYSQELRLTSDSADVTWQAGLYYYNESNEGILAFTNPIWDNGEANAHAVDTESYAIFGNLGFDITEKLRMGLGLRWSYEEKDVKQYDGFQVTTGDNSLLKSIDDPRVLRNTIASGTTGAKDFSETTGRISLDYTTDAGDLIYASISRGFKGGDVAGSALINGWNGLDEARDPAVVADFKTQTQIVEPEILDAIEIGFKGSFPDQNIRVSAAAFYYEYKDQQQTLLQPDPTGSSPVGIATLSNAATSKIPGLEAEIIYTPTYNWYIQGTLGLLDPTYDDFKSPLEGGEDYSGNQISLTPKYEFTGLARYQYEIDSGGLAFQLGFSAKGSVFFQPVNDDTQAGALMQEDSLVLWNGRISYTPNDGNWNVAIIGKNLTNEKYFGSGFDVSSLGWVAVKPGARQYFGVQFNYDFSD